MSRTIEKPGQAIPQLGEINPNYNSDEHEVQHVFTAAETAQIAREYAMSVRALELLRRRKDVFTWWGRTSLEWWVVKKQWESLFNSPEWGGKG